MFNKYDAYVAITVEGITFTAYLSEKDNKAYLVEPASDRVVFTLNGINAKTRYEIHTAMKKAARWVLGRDKWLGKLEKEGMKYVGDEGATYSRKAPKKEKKVAANVAAWKGGWGYEGKTQELEEDTQAGQQSSSSRDPRWKKNK